MFNVFNFDKTKDHEKMRQGCVMRVARKQIQKNKAVIESLRAYDVGTKNISTADVKRRLRGI